MEMPVGRRPADVAVTFAEAARALVVTGARVEIEPAGIVMRPGTETTSDLSEVSWMIVSDEDTAGVPPLVWRATSNTRYVFPSVGRVLGTTLRASLLGLLEPRSTGLLTVTRPVPEE